MALPRSLFTPAFRYQHLNWFFVVLVGIMVFVATFATAANVTLSAITLTWDKSAQTHLTVEIPAVEDEASVPQADRVKQTLDILHAIPGLSSATLLPDSETTRLLKPWISQPEVLKAMALPSLIDIERNPGSPVTAADIQTKLKNVAEDIHVDDHASWLQDMNNLVRGLSLMAGLMIILTAFTLVIAVSLICRAIMATERETLSLLHMIGADDMTIARNFQTHARNLASRASWIGFLLAALFAGVLLFCLRHFTNAAFEPMHWVILAIAVLLVPLTAIWMSASAARVSALKILRTMP